MESHYLDMSKNQEYVEMENLEAREYVNLSMNIPPPGYQCGKAIPYDYFNKYSDLEMFIKTYKEGCKVLYYLLLLIVASIITIVAVIVYLHFVLTNE